MTGQIKSNGTPEGNSFVELFNIISDRRERQERDWVAELRDNGIKAAHPDDGWVDRVNNVVQFVYPQFNDGVGKGDKIALGWPDEYRIVAVTEVEVTDFLSRSTFYKFTEIK